MFNRLKSTTITGLINNYIDCKIVECLFVCLTNCLVVERLPSSFLPRFLFPLSFFVWQNNRRRAAGLPQFNRNRNRIEFWTFIIFRLVSSWLRLFSIHFSQFNSIRYTTRIFFLTIILMSVDFRVEFLNWMSSSVDIAVCTVNIVVFIIQPSRFSCSDFCFVLK